MNDAEFASLRRLIHDAAGIWLADSKRVLLASRLGRRLRALRLGGFAAYHDLVTTRDPEGRELVELINCITTNKTEFFREPHHFEFLKRELLPALRSSGSGPIRIWSAGCSTGEEAWSIAITALECLGAEAMRRVRILASDIDTQVLARAAAGTYPRESLDAVDPKHRRAHFLRGRDAAAGLVRIHPDVARMVAFRRINLNSPGPWPIHGRFDAIFCRNVIIYFDRATQARLLRRFADHLDAGGCLFLGHSESLCERIEGLAPIGDTVHRRVPPRRPGPPVPGPALEQVRINAGELHAAHQPTVIRTVLGSCVAACLFDARGRIGGMNHFMLPDSGGHKHLPNRFGVHAMEVLINSIMNLGGDRRRLQAKVFGGADVLAITRDGPGVAARNRSFVREFLANEGIPIVAERMGGRRALEVRFETHTGRALVKAHGSRAAVAQADAVP